MSEKICFFLIICPISKECIEILKERRGVGKFYKKKWTHVMREKKKWSTYLRTRIGKKKKSSYYIKLCAHSPGSLVGKAEGDPDASVPSKASRKEVKAFISKEMPACSFPGGEIAVDGDGEVGWELP